MGTSSIMIARQYPIAGIGVGTFNHIFTDYSFVLAHDRAFGHAAIDEIARLAVGFGEVVQRLLAARHDDSRPGGRVVLMTSGQHLAPMGSEVAYAVSKGALQQATLTLADELVDRGITVNTVNPGPTDTGWGLADLDPAKRMPFGRWGRPEDAARLVAWLCSDDASWITGQTINSEGGFRRWS